MLGRSRSCFRRPWSTKTNQDAPCDETAFKDGRQRALELQRDQKWCDAQAAWDRLLKQIPQGDGCAPQQSEAEANLRIAKKRCTASTEGVDAVRLPEDPQQRSKQPPTTAVPEDQLLAAYPVGRHVRCLGFTGITGRGESTTWLLHGTNNFDYEYRVVAEIKVTENNGRRLGCEIHFTAVQQVRAVSKRAFNLAAPESPLLKAIWERVDQELRVFPPYLIVRRIQDVLDPKLEWALTVIGNKLYLPQQDDEIVALFNQFSGLRARAEYISGLGVTKLDVLEGKKFAKNDLENLAYNLTPLMDYFIGTVADAKVGEEKVLQVQDLLGMLAIDFDVAARGSLAFAKVKDTSPGEGGETELEIRGGEVLVQGRVGDSKQTGTIKPLSGKVRYRPAQHLISRAEIKWEANIDWVNENNLLFGTTGVTNLKMLTYYEAERVDPAPPSSKP